MICVGKVSLRLLLVAQDALAIASITETVLGAQPLPDDKVPRELSRLLPEGNP